MTTDCLTSAHAHLSADRKIHDAVLGVVVAVIFVIPATLAALTLF
jgi:hypothetical protein